MINPHALTALLRPQQWVKNGFVLLPMFFGGALFQAATIGYALIACAAFSCAASGVYCLNDIIDAEADRKHPRKCQRPIASGTVTARQASLLLALALLLALSIALIGLPADAAPQCAALIAGYFGLNVAYCLKFKQYAIVDVFIVALGFVLRVVMGGIACSIWLSPWIVIMTFLLALFLVFAKRRDDVILLNDSNNLTRQNTLHYNLPFLNSVLGVLASITMVSYIIYTVQPDVVARMGTQYLYVTSIFVLAGIIRYMQLAIVYSRTGSPTKVLIHDLFTQICVAGWFFTFLLLIYL